MKKQRPATYAFLNATGTDLRPQRVHSGTDLMEISHHSNDYPYQRMGGDGSPPTTAV